MKLLQTNGSSERAESEPGLIMQALTALLSRGDLPDTPPSDPMPLLAEWYEAARQSGKYLDFNAMTLATASPDGAPSARIVLCKAIESDPPAIVFYTNYLSRKGQEIDTNPRAAAVFHWPHAGRQVRIEGDVQRVSAAESDAYFKTRPLLSRIGAAASCQGKPLASRAELVAAAARIAGQAGITGEIPRPDHWGGYRLHIRTLELWSAREGRLHDRMIWKRVGTNAPIAWRAERISA